MKWIGRFGFGKPTGLDFPGESGGIVPSYPDQWSGTTIGNVPIGQGIAVTPIQIASAYAAIANGGVWIQPHLVERVGGRTLHSFKHRRIVSPAVDQELKTMLTGVVDEHGATGNAAQIAGYTVAGKTGTAQIPGPHGYTTGKYVASFVGMVPVKTPRLLVLVSVERAARPDLRRRRRGPGVRRRSPSSTCSTWRCRRTRRCIDVGGRLRTPARLSCRWI